MLIGCCIFESEGHHLIVVFSLIGCELGLLFISKEHSNLVESGVGVHKGEGLWPAIASTMRPIHGEG